MQTDGFKYQANHQVPKDNHSLKTKDKGEDSAKDTFQAKSNETCITLPRIPLDLKYNKQATKRNEMSQETVSVDYSRKAGQAFVVSEVRKIRDAINNPYGDSSPGGGGGFGG